MSCFLGSCLALHTIVCQPPAPCALSWSSRGMSSHLCQVGSFQYEALGVCCWVPVSLKALDCCPFTGVLGPLPGEASVDVLLV